MKVAYLDHYDSFTYNIIDWLRSSSELEIEYLTYDDPEAVSGLFDAKRPLVLSPGPHRPESIPTTMNLVNHLMGHVPMLGICLGHQCIGKALGGQIVRAKKPFHGSGQIVKIIEKSLVINSLSTSFVGAHYNSLVVARGSLDERYIWAVNEEDEIEGIWAQPGLYPALGVQYHPESFLSDDQSPLLNYWLESVRGFYKERVKARQ